MQNKQLSGAAPYVRQGKRRRTWHKALLGLAGAVVFGTTYALMLPAVAQELPVHCGVEAHTHTEDCFTRTSAGQVLACAPEEGVPTAHTHGALCYDPAGVLVCAFPEVAQTHIHTEDCYAPAQPVLHAHTEDCYTTERGALTCALEEQAAHSHGTDCYTAGALVCTLEEQTAHAHGEDCYSKNLTCTLDEGHTHHWQSCQTVYNLVCTEEHTHDWDTCYTVSYSCGQEENHTHGDACYDKTLTCTLEEREGHAHTAACYEQVLDCTLTEGEGHTHADGCYDWVKTLTCGLEEGQEEPADETDRELTCTEPVLPEHVHSDACFAEAAEPVLTCPEPEGEGHTHTALCYGVWELTCTLPEHEHTTACHSDPTADAETEADWEQLARQAGLTGEAAADIAALAQSQIGYTESVLNYEVDEDGVTTHGYTRYGDWMGRPYGDWNAAFTAFCLHWSGAADETLPLNGDPALWVEELKAAGRYSSAVYHVPAAGDAVFFDEDGDGTPDRSAIVQAAFTDPEAAELGDDQIVRFTAIEGDVDGRVAAVEYAADDPAIFGYVALDTTPDEMQSIALNYVQGRIAELPTAAEIEARMAAYEAAEDWAGEEAWLTELYEQVGETYDHYTKLAEWLQHQLDGRDKLMELEFIWSAAVFAEGNYGVMPAASGAAGANRLTPIQTASTRKFIDLNLYDYSGAINDRYLSTRTIGYGSSGNKTSDYPGFQWNGGAYKYWAVSGTTYYDRNRVDNIDFGNSVITDIVYRDTNGDQKKSESAVNVAFNRSLRHNINSLDFVSNTDFCNRPVGMSLGNVSGTSSLSVLAHTLGADEAPRLKSIGNAGWGSDPLSLGYLFRTDTAGGAVTKLNDQSIDGLFQYDAATGMYSYNSRENHAQYNAADDTFTVYEQIVTPNFIVYPFGNFLPLNDITQKSTATQVSSISRMSTYLNGLINRSAAVPASNPQYASQQQLATMLREYKRNVQAYGIHGKSWNSFSAYDAIWDYLTDGGQGPGGSGDAPTDPGQMLFPSGHLERMYNIDFDVPTNFFFGMDMEMDFYQPKGGMTGADKDKDGDFDYPMQFAFAGDDDVWVYVDGVLFLDLTGIHRHVGGKIDFVNGKVYYYKLDVANGGDVAIDWQTDSGSGSYRSFTFAQLLTAAGKNPADYLKYEGGRYTTFKDYTTHNFKFYYMERGSGSSVCRLQFNFPLMQQNTLAVEKALTDSDATKAIEALGDPDFLFKVLAAQPIGENGVVTGFDKTEESYFDKYDEVGFEWAYELEELITDANGDPVLDAAGQRTYSTLQEIVINDKNLDGSVKRMQAYQYDAAGNKTLVRSEHHRVDGEDVATSNEVVVIEDYGAAGKVVRRASYYAADYRQTAAGAVLYPAGTHRVELFDEGGAPVCVKQTAPDGTLTVTDAAGAAVTDPARREALEAAAGKPLVRTIAADGSFTLKAGQRARFVGIPESWGYYYIREVLPEALKSQYDKVTVSVEQQTFTNGGVHIETSTVEGVETEPCKGDMTGTFLYANDIDVTRLGKLKIAKSGEVEPGIAFDFRVLLDGAPLPVNTPYTLLDSEGNVLGTGAVKTAGVVSLEGGQAALIEGILAGTAFEVTETAAPGYVTKYKLDGTDVTAAGKAAGTIKVCDPAAPQVVLVEVINNPTAAQVQLTAAKTLANLPGGDTAQRDYTFTLQPVTVDAWDGTVPKTLTPAGEAETKTVKLGEGADTDSDEAVFTLSYRFDANGPDEVYHYRLTEGHDRTDTAPNPTAWVVQVTVVKNNGVSAQITGVWKAEDGTAYTAADSAIGAERNTAALPYENRLTAPLTLRKTVVGGEVSRTQTDYTFTLTLTEGGTALSGGFAAVRSEDGKADAAETVTFTDGTAQVALKHGQSLTLLYVPVGADWTVTETADSDPDTDFDVTVQVNGGAAAQTAGAAGTLAAAGAAVEVTYTNAERYVLPESGGPGTTLYTMAGLALLCGAACLLIWTGKGRRRAP